MEERFRYLLCLAILICKGVALFLAYELIVGGHPWFGVLFVLFAVANVSITKD